ncbi:MAG: hypothetical protein II336_03185 [Loktanella sp.]|nr:hypothetical protein [Loktanella sp.]
MAKAAFISCVSGSTLHDAQQAVDSIGNFSATAAKRWHRQADVFMLAFAASCTTIIQIAAALSGN